MDIQKISEQLAEIKRLILKQNNPLLFDYTDTETSTVLVTIANRDSLRNGVWIGNIKQKQTQFNYSHNSLISFSIDNSTLKDWYDYEITGIFLDATTSAQTHQGFRFTKDNRTTNFNPRSFFSVSQVQNTIINITPIRLPSFDKLEFTLLGNETLRLVFTCKRLYEQPATN